MKFILILLTCLTGSLLMIKYDDDSIPISAIKQYIYCKRRFGLIFIDREWGSNYKIVEGDLLHNKVNDPYFNEKRGDIYVSRSIPVYSDKLNVYGIADIVEFTKCDSGVKLEGKYGLWSINPIDYKNGKPEQSGADECQLCAVALCLEEMFSTDIIKGDLFYGKLKRRVEVIFTEELREKTLYAIADITKMLDELSIPEKPVNQICSLCSLVDICLPEAFNKTRRNRSDITNLIKRE